MRHAMMEYFKKTFQFRGRATRKEYWIPDIVLGIIGIAFSFCRVPEKVQNILAGIFSIPVLSLTSRRYQDAGVSGWFQLPQLMSFLLLPFVFMSFIKKWMKAAIIILIGLLNAAGFILTLLPGGDGNKYGRRRKNFNKQ